MSNRNGTESEMRLEVNKGFVESNDMISPSIMITPPIDEGYWIMRVPLSEVQAVVCFPKFFTIGIGFQQEEDWNTNLPHTENADDIYDHISHNKGDDNITREQCVEAIGMLKSAIVIMLKEAEGR